MRTPITYFGGKQTMLKHILPLIPEHKLYTEAFCGGCAVLFAKLPATSEVINDLNGDLVNFYIVARDNFTALQHRISLTLHSRDTHAHAAHVLKYPVFFDEIERAWAVWALSKMSFASMLDGSFGYDFGGTMPLKLRNAKAEFVEDICRRLEHTTIESRDALEVITTYDSPHAWHFVDPPYIGTACAHYEGVFGDDDLGRLLNLLSQIEGRFMLTMFPNDAIASYAEQYNWIIYRIERFISASKTSRRIQEEWLVCNYDMADEIPTLGL